MVKLMIHGVSLPFMKNHNYTDDRNTKIHRINEQNVCPDKILSYSLHLSTLPTNSSGQLNIFGHDSNTLGMDSAQVGVFEQADQVSLTGLLEGTDSCTLEAKISLEVLGNLTDQPLEWQFPYQQFCGFLVTPDLTESDCSWPVTMGLLHTTSGWGTLSGGLGGQLLTRSFSSSRFTGSLLGTGHFT